MPRYNKKSDYQRNYISKGGKESFFRVYDSLVKSEAYRKLTAKARELYILMGIYSKGSNKFNYPESEAKKYMSKDTFHNAKKQLIDNGFISATTYRTQKSIYEFSDEWKNIKKET